MSLHKFISVKSAYESITGKGNTYRFRDRVDISRLVLEAANDILEVLVLPFQVVLRGG